MKTAARSVPCAVIAVSTVCLLSASVACRRGPDTSERGGATARLNVLLITLDTTRADRIGCYGHASAETPAVDALAAEGVRFEYAYCQVPQTLPSHASLMTGAYPATIGVRVNGERLEAPSPPSLAEVFSRAGYRTAAFVSAFVLDGIFGLDRGFGRYDDRLDPAQSRAGPSVERAGANACDAALGWLDAQRAEPFFLWLHLFDPHSPYQPPEPYRGRIADAYDGEIAFADAQVGRMVSWLDEKNLRGDTLIVVAGDHGEAFGEHGETQHGFFVYEPTMRVPLVLSLPNRLPAGKVVGGPVGLIDLAPTILELAGLAPQEGHEGSSLVASWEDESPGFRPVYGECENSLRNYGWAPLYSLTTEQWRFIDAPRAELYDRRNDLEERTNLTERNPAVVAELRRNLAELRESMTPAESVGIALASEDHDRLAALGYVGGHSIEAPGDPAALLDPKNVVNAYEAHAKAVSLLGQERFGDVVELLEPFVRALPSAGVIHGTLARAYLESGRLPEAQASYESGLKAFPKAPQLLVGVGESIRQQNRPGESIEWFERALAENESTGEAHRGACLAHAALGEWDKAERHCRRHVELSPESVNALINLANLFMYQQNFADAAPLLERALRVDPRNPMAHRNYWQVLMGLGRNAESIRALRAACEAIPDDSNLLCSLAWYLALSDDPSLGPADEAVSLAERCREANPRSPRTWDILAAAHADAGDFEQAGKAAEQALSLAKEQGSQKLAAEIAARLDGYRQGRPARQP